MKLMTKLQGKKSYIIAFLIAASAMGNYFNYIPDNALVTLMCLYVALAIATTRAAIAKK